MKPPTPKQSKAEAARANGKKGGRPRKDTDSPSRQRSATTGLTRLQERFVRLYVLKPNATLAEVYREAGFKASTDEVARVNAGKLLRLDHVAAAVDAARQEVGAKLNAKYECSLDDIARELHLLGFSRMSDYVRIDKDGDPYFDLSKLTPEQFAAIGELTVEDFKDGRGEDAREVRRIKLKLSGKREALVDLAKLLGYYRERVEVSEPIPMFALPADALPDLGNG